MKTGAKHSAETRARLRAGMRTRSYRPIRCVACGGEFVPDHSRRTTCSAQCKRDQKLRVYHVWKTTPSGGASIRAFNARRARLYAADPSSHRDARLRDNYGLTREQWRILYGQQEGRCAICCDVLRDDRYTHVDHCHSSHRVRGLLCNRCNVAIGMFRENPSLMRAAIQYVERHRLTLVKEA